MDVDYPELPHASARTASVAAPAHAASLQHAQQQHAAAGAYLAQLQAATAAVPLHAAPLLQPPPPPPEFSAAELQDVAAARVLQAADLAAGRVPLPRALAEWALPSCRRRGVVDLQVAGRDAASGSDPGTGSLADDSAVDASNGGAAGTAGVADWQLTLRAYTVASAYASGAAAGGLHGSAADSMGHGVPSEAHAPDTLASSMHFGSAGSDAVDGSIDRTQRVYWLEGVAGLLAALGAREGDAFALTRSPEADGRLAVEPLNTVRARAAAEAAGALLAAEPPPPAGAALVPAVDEPWELAAPMVTCTRTAGCTKAAGHQGFCSGHKGFAKRRGAYENYVLRTEADGSVTLIPTQGLHIDAGVSIRRISNGDGDATGRCVAVRL